MLILILFYFIKRKSGRRKNKKFLAFIDTYTDDSLNFNMVVDDNKVIIHTNESILKLPWNVFKEYMCNETTIYIFNSKIPMQSLFFSPEDLGEENFLFFKNLVTGKLPGMKYKKIVHKPGRARETQ